jgi:hypothetical protein
MFIEYDLPVADGTLDAANRSIRSISLTLRVAAAPNVIL